MSQLAGAPVRLQFMRWDEHGWDNYGPAVLADLRGGVDASGKIVALDYTAFGIPEHVDDRRPDEPARRHAAAAARARQRVGRRTPARSTTSRTGG